MENNENQKIGWYKSLSKKTKILLGLGLAIHVLYTFYATSYGYPNFSSYTGRLIGFFIAVFFPALVISLVISAIPYFMFRKIAEKWKRYLDYVAVVFLVVSLVLIYSGLKTQQRVDDYRTSQRDFQF